MLLISFSLGNLYSTLQISIRINRVICEVNFKIIVNRIFSQIS